MNDENDDKAKKLKERCSVKLEQIEDLEEYYMFYEAEKGNFEKLNFVLLEQTAKRGEKVKFEVKTEGEFVKVYCSSAAGEEEVYSAKVSDGPCKEDFVCHTRIEGDLVVFELKFKDEVVSEKQFSRVNELVNKDVKGENLILREEWNVKDNMLTMHLVEIFTDSQGTNRKEVHKAEYSLESEGLKVDLSETEQEVKVAVLEGENQVYERIFSLVTYEIVIEEETVEEEGQTIYRKKEITTSSTGEKTEKIIEERVEKKEETEEAAFEEMEMDGDSLGQEDFFNG